MIRTELAVPGVPETVISEALIARLPGNLAPAPWDARCTAMIWGTRGGAAASEALPPALRGQKALAVIGGMVRYEYTPVGTYDEIFGIVVTKQGRSPVGTVVFMAVDGIETLVGGRTNWAMPKALARFSGDPLRSMTATGEESEWRVSASARPLSPAIPYRTKGSALQENPEGGLWRSALTGRFKMRPALVNVEVSSSGSLPEWLRPGRHLGAVSPQMAFSLGVPASV